MECGIATCSGCARCGLAAKDFMDAHIHGVLRDAADRLRIPDERMRSLDGWAAGGNERFLQVRSRINGKLRSVLGMAPYVKRYCIEGGRAGREAMRYSISLDPDLIRLE